VDSSSARRACASAAIATGVAPTSVIESRARGGGDRLSVAPRRQDTTFAFRRDLRSRSRPAARLGAADRVPADTSEATSLAAAATTLASSRRRR